VLGVLWSTGSVDLCLWAQTAEVAYRTVHDNADAGDLRLSV
jgi:hypothetical protein